MRCHHADHGSFPVAGSAPQQVTPAIGQIVLAKPVFPLEEKLEVAPHHAADGRIEHDGVPIVPRLQGRFLEECGMAVERKLLPQTVTDRIQSVGA